MSHYDDTPEKLTLSEQAYVHQALTRWLFGFAFWGTLSLMFGLISNDWSGDLDGWAVLSIVFGMVCACAWLPMGLIVLDAQHKPKKGLEQSRGVRGLRSRKLKVLAEGDSVTVTFRQRTTARSLLWPLAGKPPQVHYEKKTFTASEFEDQDAAHEFVSSLKNRPKRIPASSEAKALAKALK